MLNQQIQLQSKNMTSASELYSAQRKKVHDFRAHLNILNQLMKNQEYSAAEEYLEKITEQQTDRLFLVNTHHPILDALFNTKAAEATQKKISIDFEVNDLSNLPFDASDIVVLLSNLLDNAIEACQHNALLTSSIVKMMNTRPCSSSQLFFTDRLMRSSRMPYSVLASVDRF